ncbi:MAG: hypothetical protein KDD43_03735, partial [Bdellovibrionales bacterium]|nr:hypothetical protein [Bdellovibrionales bacterium]
MLKIISRQAQTLGLLVLLSQILISCTSEQRGEKPLGDFLSGEFTLGHQGVLVLTSEPQELKKRAQNMGLSATGEQVIHLSGATQVLSALNLPISSRVVPAHIPMRAVSPGVEEKPDEKIYFLAKRDFAIPELLNDYPTYDGRGVVAGVIDDGVAPSGSGMQKTTDGRRKYLRHHWTSRLLDTKVALVTAADKASTYFQAIQEEYDQAWEGVLDEETLKSYSGATHDLNGDGKKTKLAVVALKKGDRVRFCVDTNGDSQVT